MEAMGPTKSSPYKAFGSKAHHGPFPMPFTAMLRDPGAKTTIDFAIRSTLLQFPPMERIENLDPSSTAGNVIFGDSSADRSTPAFCTTD
jgi:hypothetical protein